MNEESQLTLSESVPVETRAPGSNPLAIVLQDPERLAKLDTDKLEALMSLQERIDDREAEKALAAALSQFQGQAPEITKTRDGHNSKFASLDDIMRAIRPYLAENGLSVSFNTITGDKTLTAVCHVTHAEGAQFSRSVEVPVDQRMSANDSQKMGSAISYGKRYALCAALNLIVTDQDDDGEAAGTATIDEETAETIKGLMADVALLDEDANARFLAWAGVQSADDIPASKGELAVKNLRRKLEELRS